MKFNTKIALILAASVISCSAFAQSVSAPKTDSLLSSILGEQVQTNQHLVQLLAKDQDAGITLTPEQKKTSCLYESHYYSSGAPLTVGKETLRCTLSGEIPTGKMRTRAILSLSKANKIPLTASQLSVPK